MASDNIVDILTPEGWELLNSLGPYTEADSLRLTGQLRKAGHPAERVAAALTQSRLRSRAASGRSWRGCRRRAGRPSSMAATRSG